MAAKKAENISGKLHTVKTSINTKKVRKQGRPPKNGTTPMNMRYILSWELIENSTEVECIKFMAGCFVLLTNDFIERDGAMDGKKILQVYKGRYGVEVCHKSSNRNTFKRTEGKYIKKYKYDNDNRLLVHQKFINDKLSMERYLP